jgi:hypothetical protein
VLAGTSGLLIALSRTVQYQSFITLFSILAIYLAWKYVQTGKTYFSVITGIVCGLGLLFHYDFLVPIIAICLYLVLQRHIKGLVLLLVSIFFTSAIFYMPFILHPNFRSTLQYILGNRINSPLPVDSIKSTLVILQIYHSKEWLVGFAALSLVSMIFLFNKLSSAEKFLFISSCVFILLRLLFNTQYPILVYLSVISASALFISHLFKVIRSQKNPPHFIELILIWFFIGFISYGLFFSKPMTHIYTFFIPAFILVAQGAHKANIRYQGFLSAGMLLAMTISGISFNYQAFINTAEEYPWDKKSYLFGTMPPWIAEGELIQGIFGFPYRRDWHEIDAQLDVLGTNEIDKTYFSNEKVRLTRYYIRDFTWDEVQPNYFVYVEKPQSLNNSPAPIKTPLVTGRRYAIYKN